MNGGHLEAAELGEKLLDVRVGHAKVEVGDDQFSRAAAGRDSSATRSVVEIVAPGALGIATSIRRSGSACNREQNVQQDIFINLPSPTMIAFS